MKRSTKQACGFSLVEVLVIIIIVSILATLILPVFKKAKDASKAAGCIANLRGWGRTIALYSADHNGLLPWGSWLEPDPNNPGQNIQIKSNPRIPDWAWEYSGSVQKKAGVDIPFIMARCPGEISPVDKKLWFYMGYLMNPYLFVEYTSGVPSKRSPNPDGNFIRLGEVPRKILMADSVDAVEAVVSYGSNGMNLCNVSEELGTGGSLLLDDFVRLSRRVSRRHGGSSANALFGDASVQAIQGNQITENDLH